MKIHVVTRSYFEIEGANIVGVFSSRELAHQAALRENTDDGAWVEFIDSDGIAYFDTPTHHMEISTHELDGISDPAETREESCCAPIPSDTSSPKD